MPTYSFILNLLGSRHVTPRKFWEVEILLGTIERKKSHPHHRHICVTCKLEKQLFRGVSYVKTIFLNSCKISRKLSIRNSDSCNPAAQLYLNYSPQWIFFFHHSNNWEIIFWKNCSDRLLRQLLPISLSWLYI